MGFIDDIYDENIVTGDTFAVITGLDAENAPELYSGTITGENEYKVYIVIRPAEGYAYLDRFNATYNTAYIGYGYEAVNAGRYRGLTVWPWTYILI